MVILKLPSFCIGEANLTLIDLLPTFYIGEAYLAELINFLYFIYVNPI